ncbi:MAG: HAD hydrolase-like protein, partial [Bacteroidetes bacterium]|nr:HAD hydrolase-like protein [Bacteroidota bacterium]
ARAHGFEPVRADRAVIIGDTEHDIGCSRHAGMAVVAVATGRIDLETLRAHGPDLLLPDLEDTDVVMAFLDQVASR